MPKVIWWGRSDLNYSRNRISRQLLQALGCQLIDFRPHLSGWGDVEAQLKGLPTPDLVWVPCFRHRDVEAASRWARRRAVPLVFDPLISAWQKQVYERNKFAEQSPQAQRLLSTEKKCLQLADMVLLDTALQQQMFIERFGLSAEKTAGVYVGAEQPLFSPVSLVKPRPLSTEVLFYGSFIALHGVETVIEAARLTAGQPHLRWVLLGDGPTKAAARQQAAGLANVHFEDSLAYPNLPGRIAKADIVLGVFGGSQKAAQVIPNKVFQGLACGRPVITRNSDAYPAAMPNGPLSGLWQIEAANPAVLADAVMQCVNSQQDKKLAARTLYTQYFSPAQLEQQLKEALGRLGVSFECR